MPADPYFFSCDWGTSSMRLRLVETGLGCIQSELESTLCGVRQVGGSMAEDAPAEARAAAFQTVLGQQIAALPGAGPMVEAGAPVVVSGMASSSIGWKELTYAAVPFALDGSQARCEWLEVRVTGRTSPVLLVSGLATVTEIMRGEETQLIGLLAQAAFAECTEQGLIVLPGTHSKHVRVRDGQIVGLQTFMTGELFDVLRTHSVLRFTTGGDETAFDEQAFVDGVDASKTASRSLFQVRTRGVLGGQPGQANRAFLSGLLIGAELREGLDCLSETRVLLAAPDPVVHLYHLAAAQLDVAAPLLTAGSEELLQAVVTGHRMLLESCRRP